ncbi:polyprenol monophosphomannose synthase [Subtercola sp. PAMC28395]|uniref:polyprenol monophosphomannose synthase n=1 Tax=Subtercola sp. PAMC28395 TaxID=2846775 RepID=UPI001C0D267D|nr:polyprenol monophosphomannose synthase [Subtercola sp. PAMC28395]QWT24984.1 polyprenol monophosphomannose synthase [Subtercola sp. PAMC28395]
MPGAVVVIPTYREKETIAAIIERVLKSADVHVLVVDDNSPDGTGQIVDAIAATDERVNIMHRTEKNGLGTAYVAGFGWALDKGYDYIIEMDADGSHQPEELPRLIKLLDAGANLGIGARWIPGGKTENWPWYRKLISRSGTTYARIMLKSKLHDITSGYRGFSAETLRALDLSQLDSAGYVFQIELAWLVERSGGVVREFPITFIERLEGQSKMTTGIVVEALSKVTTWGIASRLGRIPKSQSLAAR